MLDAEGERKPQARIRLTEQRRGPTFTPLPLLFASSWNGLPLSLPCNKNPSCPRCPPPGALYPDPPPTLPLSSQRKQPLLPLPLQCHLLPHVSVMWVTWEHGGSLGAVPLFPPPKQRFSQLRQQTFSEQLLCLVPWMCGHQWMRTWGKDRQMDPCSDGMGRDTSQCGLQRLLTHPLPRAFLTP